MLAEVKQWDKATAPILSIPQDVADVDVTIKKQWVEAPQNPIQQVINSVDLDKQEQMLQRKYIMDVVLTLAAMPIALPLMGLVALAIKLDSKGDIIFRQERVGRFGRSFTCLKFRSMRIDAEEIKQALMKDNEASGPVFKMKRDPRITRVGRLIRKLSLDELPQLFNVLRGDMSLVGPRPPIPAEVEKYHDWQYGRLATIPGVTGLQQVSGRSDLDFDTWVELDLEYIKTQSIRNDILILLKTIPAVITGKGAY